MITDSERILDGFRGLPAGMDGSKDPPQTPSEAAWYATNVTFRGGNGPRTRPGFREIPPTYWRNPVPPRVNSSLIGDGDFVTVTTSVAHGYITGEWVTVSGADAAYNGLYKITVTGGTTYTYANSTLGTSTATGTSMRDVDYTFDVDIDGAGTSYARYNSLVVAGKYLQGTQIYQDPRDDNPAQMILVVDGSILALNFSERSCRRLNPVDPMNASLPVYLIQAERFIIIQNGVDEPRVFDGSALYRASYFGPDGIPIGKQMAYGQGRLFVVVNDGSEIVAGDLAFGGSTTSVGITSSSAANPTVITTAAPHGFVIDDIVTIQGHSSSPWLNSTYVVTATPATTTFSIGRIVTSTGRGGYVTRFNAGQDSDCLRFTETRFLNEGGNLAVSGQFGKIVALAFLPVQDTATGQGDLIAFCESGAVTFAVSTPRDQWKSTPGFQRILFDNIGSANSNILAVNGDLFFRSKQGNGVRTYRNARAEIESYGQTTVSAEIDPILRQDTQWLLGPVTFALFDNRLLMTCLPQQLPRRAISDLQAEEFAQEPVPTIFNGISVLDFKSTSAGRGKSSAVYDGVWTGLRVLNLAQGLFGGDPRCFALCLHEDGTGRKHEIWEVTKEDEYDTPIEGPRLINSGIVTRAFDFRDAMSLKKLLRCDLWFDEIGGGPENIFTCELAYRPDDYPNFTTWQTFTRGFVTEFLLEDKNILAFTEKFENNGWVKTNTRVIADDAQAPNETLTADTLEEDATDGVHLAYHTTGALPSGANYFYSTFAKADSRNRIYLTLSSTGGAFSSDKTAHFFLSASGTVSHVSAGVVTFIEPLQDGWYRVGIGAVTDGAGTTRAVVGLAAVAGTASYQGNNVSGLYLWGAQMEATSPSVISPTSYDPDPPQLLNFERGYAPQVKFPTPPRTANLATDVPTYLGNDFTLRVNWVGKAHLGRLMLHGQRVTEAVGGGTL